uniref:Potassium channel regulatory protein unc-93 n=1 Tax=Panagrellus redivivus TaxID=6233 RepID=A0A7E4V181_PANRE
MSDGNAWDLVEGGTDAAASSAAERDFRRSRSPSNFSKIGSEALADIDPEELSIIMEQERRDRNRRSKSPAVESIRKVSRVILQKVGIRPKKKDTWIPLRMNHDIDYVLLDDLCLRPTQTKMPTPPPTARSVIPKILSSSVLKGRKGRKTDGKCSYLFRSTDDVTVDPEVANRPINRIGVYDPYCPVHGSRRRISRRRQLVDMHSFVTSVETVDNETLNPILQSQAYYAKILRKRRRANLTGDERVFVEKTKRKILTNLFVISIAFLFLFTAFNALQNLQTSINGDMGSDSLFVLYLSLAVSSLFVPSFVLNRLGSKLTLVTAFSIYILYMIANFLPKYYSLMPVSVLTGMAGSCLWAAKCVYITESGIKYAKLNVEAQNVVIVRFFGYFFMVVHLGQVAGNLLTSFVFTKLFGLNINTPEDVVDNTCGHGFIDNVTKLSPQAIINLERPPTEAFLSIVSVNLGCSFVALLIVAFFLNALKRDGEAKAKAPHFTLDVLRLTLRNLRRPKPMLLVPLTVFNGIEQAFAVGVYTKAYVGCGLGIGHIGYVMTAFGVADAICSLVFGPLIKLFGRMPLFVFGAVINMLMIITLMIWPLNPSDGALFYVIAGVWGMADGVWNTQINGFWVALVGRDSLEVAFANYRFWISLGLAVGFILIRFTSIDMYLLVAFFVLLVGFLGYLIIELYEYLTAYFHQLFEACFIMCGAERKPSTNAETLETGTIYYEGSEGSLESDYESVSDDENKLRIPVLRTNETMGLGPGVIRHPSAVSRHH